MGTSMTDALDAYFGAWNARDPGAVVSALTAGGTYEDPTTGGPVSGATLAAVARQLFEGFPDVHFDLEEVAATGPATAVARWRMQGTNTGPMPGGPPTGGRVDLPGADFLTYDENAGKLSKVVGYFDTATMLAQLGFQAHITPADVEGLLTYGSGLRVETGRLTPPGAFTLTWIDIDPEGFPKLAEITQGVVTELMGEPGYLGSCFLNVGRRHYTLSAWESAEVATRSLRSGAHKEAMRMVFGGELGSNAFGITSIWEPERLNGVFRASTGSTAPLSELGAQWL